PARKALVSLSAAAFVKPTTAMPAKFRSMIILPLLLGVLILPLAFSSWRAAKRGGVQVDEFWIGMGPKLLQKQVGETTYCLCLLPIGGACVMSGEDQESDNPRAFGNAKWLTRFIILVAGVVMNFILGFVILLCL